MSLDKNVDDMDKEFRDLEAEVDHRQRSIATYKEQLDYNQYQSKRQEERVTNYREELMALKQHVDTLDEQNKRLFRELEQFADVDEDIKHTLNKRGRVVEMKTQMKD